FIPVRLRRTRIDTAELVRRPCVIQQVFGSRGLARVDMGNNADIADLTKVGAFCDCHGTYPKKEPQRHRGHREKTQRRTKGSIARSAGKGLPLPALRAKVSYSSLCVTCLCVLCASGVRNYQAKCANALFDSAILIVFSRLVMASPSRR